jgi:hypothetical protein
VGSRTPWQTVILGEGPSRKGSAEIYESGNIKTGDASVGPFIGLTGTLHCLRRDVFIKQVKVIVTRKRDHDRYELT